MVQEEIWKDISGYEGLYQVSNLGRFKSLKFGNKIMKVTFIRKIPIIQLRSNNNGKQFPARKIIAKAFIPNPLNLNRVMFKENFNDLSYDNLYWTNMSEILKKTNQRTTKIDYVECKTCSTSFLVKYGIKRDYCSTKCYNAQPKRKKTVDLIRISKYKSILLLQDDKEIEFKSVQQVSNFLGLNPSTVSNILCGRSNSKKHKISYKK